MIAVKPFAKSLLSRRQRVLCVGLSKTGTTTFMEACKVLGYKHKTMGFDHAYVNKRMLPIHLAAIQHESFDDYPWFFLYRYFDQHFPRTKFLLTVRSNTEIWYDSICRHYLREGGNLHRVFGLSNPNLNRQHYCNFYESHNRAVREYFLGDPRFLEICWEHGNSWELLCDFLEKPVPQIRFPHANKSPDRTTPL